MSDGLLGLPRVPLLVAAPTPLVPAPRLSRELGVEIWFKRDDLTGLGLGGNKVRGLEFLLADAERKDADCLVTGAGPQSNWALLAATAARLCGLDPFVVHYGSDAPAEGNQLLHRIVGTTTAFTGDAERASVDAEIERRADALRDKGRRPYVIPRGGGTPLAAVGYVQTCLELLDQLQRLDVRPNELWLATGSCSTQAGLVAGTRWLRMPVQPVGVTVSRPVAECRTRIAKLAAEAAELVGAPTHDHRVQVLDGYLGPGYGQASPEGAAATALVARTEGVLLDPVFAAKAMAGLIDACRGGHVEGPVVFLVTGGAPTLFTDSADPANHGREDHERRDPRGLPGDIRADREGTGT